MLLQKVIDAYLEDKHPNWHTTEMLAWGTDQWFFIERLPHPISTGLRIEILVNKTIVFVVYDDIDAEKIPLSYHNVLDIISQQLSIIDDKERGESAE